MSLEEREGTLDQVSPSGIVLGGQRLNYSKWFDGERLKEDALGRTLRVMVDAGEKCSFLKKVLRIGDKVPGWTPPLSQSSKGGSWGGQGRRMSPEELDLKREEGTRIARSVAIDRAITMAEKGIPMERIVDLASAVEAYLLKGILPQATQVPLPEVPAKKAEDTSPSEPLPQPAPSSDPVSSPTPLPAKKSTPPPPAKFKKLAASIVNDLFNEAMRGGLVDDWPDYLDFIEGVLKARIKSPYHMSALQFSKVEAIIRSKLGKESAA